MFQKFFKFRHSSYNKTVSSKENLKKFKEKILNYEKIFRQFIPKPIRLDSKAEIEKLDKDINSIKPNKRMSEQKKLPQPTLQDYDTNKATESRRNSMKTYNSNRIAIKLEKETSKKQSSSNVSSSKLFICIGGYPDIINALVSRGWTQLHDAKR